MKTKKLYLFLSLCFGLLPISLFAAKIVYVSTPTTNSDQAYNYIKKYCTDNGHSFYEVPPSSATLSTELANADMMMISAIANGHADSVAAFLNHVGANPAIPIMCWSPAYMHALKMTSSAGASYNSAKYVVYIDTQTDNAALAGGLTGKVEVYNFVNGIGNSAGSNDKNIQQFINGDIATGAKIITRPCSGSDVNVMVTTHGSSFSVETGAALFGGLTANARRVVQYFTAWTTGGSGNTVYNSNTGILFEASFNWLLAGNIVTSQRNTASSDSKNYLQFSQKDNTIKSEIAADIRVFNTAGKLCLHANSNELSVESLSPGLYLVKANSKEGASSTLKFHKN